MYQASGQTYLYYLSLLPIFTTYLYMYQASGQRAGRAAGKKRSRRQDRQGQGPCQQRQGQHQEESVVRCVFSFSFLALYATHPTPTKAGAVSRRGCWRVRGAQRLLVGLFCLFVGLFCLFVGLFCLCCWRVCGCAYYGYVYGLGRRP